MEYLRLVLLVASLSLLATVLAALLSARISGIKRTTHLVGRPLVVDPRDFDRLYADAVDVLLSETSITLKRGADTGFEEFQFARNLVEDIRDSYLKVRIQLRLAQKFSDLGNPDASIAILLGAIKEAYRIDDVELRDESLFQIALLRMEVSSSFARYMRDRSDLRHSTGIYSEVDEMDSRLLLAKSIATQEGREGDAEYAYLQAISVGAVEAISSLANMISSQRGRENEARDIMHFGEDALRSIASS